MEILKLDIDGLLLITPKVFSDERGFFCERFKESDLAKLGLKKPFIQDNFSHSKYKVLRGLHYQNGPSQGKMVTCCSGQILDVAVDLRKKHSTYGQYQAVILSADKPQWFYIPEGFAHGFLVLSETGADVIYKVNAPYSPSSEGSILWADPDLKISWKESNPVLSPKDKAALSWKDFQNINPF